MHSTLFLTEEQEHALTLALLDHNVFITGKAGSGKSTFLQSYRKLAGEDVIFAAPTGVAAVNIGGTTLHRLFNLPVGCGADIMKDFTGPVDPAVCEVLQSMKTLVIDEISMVPADVFAAVERILRAFPLSECGAFLPFGGRQIICVGDFAQLAPVADSEQARMLNEMYGGTYAFNTQAWRSANFIPVALKTSLRQFDSNWVEILDGIRRADVNAVARFNEQVTISSPPEDAVILCPNHRRANAINREMDARLNSPVHTLRGLQDGIFPDENKATSSNLELREGSRVMCVANCPTDDVLDSGFHYVNGDCGWVKAISRDHRCVEVELDCGKVKQVTPRVWRNMIYTVETDPVTGEKHLQEEEIGWFLQFPLRLTYAMTIHKSQGLTLNKVHLELGGGMFLPHQLYTAVTRTRGQQSLSLDRCLFYAEVMQDPAAVSFCEEIERRAVITYCAMNENVQWT